MAYTSAHATARQPFRRLCVDYGADITCGESTFPLTSSVDSICSTPVRSGSRNVLPPSLERRMVSRPATPLRGHLRHADRGQQAAAARARCGDHRTGMRGQPRLRRPQLRLPDRPRLQDGQRLRVCVQRLSSPEISDWTDWLRCGYEQCSTQQEDWGRSWWG